MDLAGSVLPYLPWAAKLRDDRREQEAKDNPDARCLPLGPLQMLAHPLPKKIVQMPGLLVLLHERNMEFRQIFLDGRPLPADQQPSWYGYSTAAGRATRWWSKRRDSATACGPTSTAARSPTRQS